MATVGAVAQWEGTQTFRVIDSAPIHWDKDKPERVDNGFVLRFAGQTIERTINLPKPPSEPKETPRILATVRLRPEYAQQADGRVLPNDKWTRLGSVSVVVPGSGGKAEREVELMRFISPYGGPATYRRDITAFAPLLHGRRTFRAFLSSYSAEPGWKISFSLTYTDEQAGFRRPVLVDPLFNDAHVEAGPGGAATLSGTVQIPPGLARPRIMITTTGHATDGAGGNEFISSPHVLEIDDQPILRWRPWSERGSGLRTINPWAAKMTRNGKEFSTSDFDRSGWHPGLAVEPLVVPAPELRPGKHTIVLRIEGIRPPDPVPADEEGPGAHGYWVVSAVVLADEPLGNPPQTP